MNPAPVPKRAKAKQKPLPSSLPRIAYRYQYENADVLTDLAPAKDDKFAQQTCSLVVVIPCVRATDKESRASARELVRVAKFFALPKAEQADKLAAALYYHHRPKRRPYKYLPFAEIEKWEQASYRERAIAVLAAIGGRP